jgi:hypothetical protein
MTSEIRCGRRHPQPDARVNSDLQARLLAQILPGAHAQAIRRFGQRLRRSRLAPAESRRPHPRLPGLRDFRRVPIAFAAGNCPISQAGAALRISSFAALNIVTCRDFRYATARVRNQPLILNRSCWVGSTACSRPGVRKHTRRPAMGSMSRWQPASSKIRSSPPARGVQASFR